MKQFLLSFLTLVSILLNAQPKYEFRGVWVATVDNIDWPSRNNTNSENQKQEFIRLLDMHRRNGMNAVIVQIRPAADAFYQSSYEPWSQWLTGKQGKPPYPFYDPLKFMIEETHKRAMEFHAWLNPYRANFNIGNASIAENHITRIHPEWFLTYGDKKYFDPGNKNAQNFVVNVVRDILKRYDVDAIHMDDYFYPYRIAGREFPDAASYAKANTTLSKNDWRRSNVDSIIFYLSKAIKEEKKYCQFGISPFAVWRNKDKDPRGSDSRGGQSNFDDLYADILLWSKNGWIDYVAPQLYFEIGHDKIAYEKMLDWWSRNSFGRNLYIGQAVYRATEKPNAAWRNKNELPNQINLLRQYPNVHGSAFYSSHSFNKNPNGWADSLRDNYYKFPALLPAMPWISNEAPTMPLVDCKMTNDSTVSFSIKPNSDNKIPIKYYVVYKYSPETVSPAYADIPNNIIRIETKPEGFQFVETLSSNKKSYRYLITAVGKNNIESDINETAVLITPTRSWGFYKP